MRYSLKFHDWPAADQSMWHALSAAGDVLEGAGACAHWAPASKAVFVRDYGYWLSCLRDAGSDLSSNAPADRVTPESVRAYCRSMSDVSRETIAIRVQRLAILMRAAQPSGSWTWLFQLVRSLKRVSKAHGRARRKENRIVPSSRLYEAGVRLLECTSEDASLSCFARATSIRDGLMISLLAARPLRLKNFIGLRIDVHLRAESGRYLIDVPGHECKTGRPIETFVPDELGPWVTRYLEFYRPVLLAGGASSHLWINRSGRAFRPNSFSWRICELTERLTGVRLNPHLFRDCAATTIATADPAHVRMIAPLLGHGSLRTAEAHYNQARGLQAGRKFQAMVRQMRQDARPLRRRAAKV